MPRPFPFRLAALLAAALVLAAPALGQGTLGLLAPEVPLQGTDGAWSYSTSNGAAWLSNRTDPGALRYHFVSVPGDAGRDRRAEVRVQIAEAPGGAGFAGLVFGFDPEERHYLMLALHGDGRAVLYVRDRDGLRAAVTSQPAPAPGWRTLSVIETGREVAWAVDGRTLGSLDRAALPGAALGIGAGGLVTAGFAGFRVGEADAPPAGTAPVAPPGGPAAIIEPPAPVTGRR